MASTFVRGLGLRPTSPLTDEARRLQDLTGPPVGIDGVLDDLNRRASVTKMWLGRAVDKGFAFDSDDQASQRWWPQGVSTSADASDTEDIAGRRVLAITWYSKEVRGQNYGSRITFVNLDTMRYRHVLLVQPALDDKGELTLSPLRIHAGGVVWHGPYLHVAATSRGLVSFKVDDILHIPEHVGTRSKRLGASGSRVASFGYRYVLPVHQQLLATTERGHTKLRYSFLSLDRSESTPSLLAGEYGRDAQTTRLARFTLDPQTQLPLADGDHVHPTWVEDAGVVQMQGCTVVGDRYYITKSRGPYAPGSMVVGRPGKFTEHRFATPFGPEDISYWPSTDTFWSVSEHPRRRWIYSMKRSWFD